MSRQTRPSSPLSMGPFEKCGCDLCKEHPIDGPLQVSMGTCIDINAARLEDSLEDSFEDTIITWMGLWTPNTSLLLTGRQFPVRIVPPDSPFDWRRHPVTGEGELDGERPQ